MEYGLFGNRGNSKICKKCVKLTDSKVYLNIDLFYIFIYIFSRSFDPPRPYLSSFKWANKNEGERIINLYNKMEDIRYIENPFAKIFNIVNPDHTQLYNLLLKLLQEFFHNVKIPTVVSLASIPAKSREDFSVYTGTGGYLVMFLKLH